MSNTVEGEEHLTWGMGGENKGESKGKGGLGFSSSKHKILAMSL